MTQADLLLDIEHLHAGYGNIEVLRHVSLQIRCGELVSLVGANGAGKSTLLKTLCGLLPVRRGRLQFAGSDITQAPTHSHAARGLVLVPEGRGIFPALTVLENLQMGAYHRDDKTEILQDLDHVFSLFPRLAERKTQSAGTLSGGEQQMVAIGRALMAKPRLLLLDEPSMGLAPILVQKIFEVIRQIHAEGVSVLLVEQNAHAALALADRGFVMEHGEIILQGSGKELLANPAVQAAYLGG